MIAKGTLVQIKTSNGGEIIASLLDNYRPTYDATISVTNGWAIIPATRITSVEVIY